MVLINLDLFNMMELPYVPKAMCFVNKRSAMIPLLAMYPNFQVVLTIVLTPIPLVYIFITLDKTQHRFTQSITSIPDPFTFSLTIPSTIA